MVFRQVLFLLVVSVVLGFGVNFLSPNGIDIVGDYREISDGDGPIVPPAAEKGDPPFIDINRANMEYSSGRTLFIDARDVEEFKCGTIPGSINIPFEYMPDGDLAVYFDSCLGGVAHDYPLVVFCSGEECDLSLHLGRNLADYGYSNVLIFFGGAREWEKNGFEVERREDCGG